MIFNSSATLEFVEAYLDWTKERLFITYKIADYFWDDSRLDWDDCYKTYYFKLELIYLKNWKHIVPRDKNKATHRGWLLKQSILSTSDEALKRDLRWRIKYKVTWASLDELLRLTTQKKTLYFVNDKLVWA